MKIFNILAISSVVSSSNEIFKAIHENNIDKLKGLWKNEENL